MFAHKQNSLASETDIDSDHSKSHCYHCGDSCPEDAIVFQEKSFCCQGCMTVYDILQAEGLDNYYAQDDSKPGVKVRNQDYEQKFVHLSNDNVAKSILKFRSDEHSIVIFSIPDIHCSSCVWLLENIHKLNSAIKKSEVNFSKREATICFNEKELSLQSLAVLLCRIGYEPQINLIDKEKKTKNSKSIYYKIGIAGFCFGNIMLLSFPEYLGIRGSGFETYQSFFNYLILLLSLPIVFYCASSFFSSAINGLSQRHINIDVPIALGISVLFSRSLYEIISGVGAGYIDSLSGLVFFLLVGKWYQNKIYDSLSFERDYKSYFPIAVTKLKDDKQIIIQTEEIKEGDKLLIRNQELVPADSTLISDNARLDFSFVTGESDLLKRKKGDLLYAGGRLAGSNIVVQVQKKVDQSYLTELWNQKAFQKRDSEYKSIIDAVGKYFTIAILSISAIGAIIWAVLDSSQIFNVVTSILIIACPCALVLTVPFTLGNAVRISGKKGFYAKGTETMEELAKVDDVVFDKTGTLTDPSAFDININGRPIDDLHKKYLIALTQNSTHPLSEAIYKYLNPNSTRSNVSLEKFEEIQGKGLKATINGQEHLLGSAVFVGLKTVGQRTSVFYAVDKEIQCHFTFDVKLRSHADQVLEELSKKYNIHLLTGDGSNSLFALKSFFKDDQFHYGVSPKEKMDYVKSLQSKGKNVLMIGDGLNDAGALKQSNVGIALSDNIHSFSPACDGILAADSFPQLMNLIKFAKRNMNLVKWGFLLSFSYNVLGISLAMSNMINPLISAILMPISSVSIVLLSTIGSHYHAKRVFKNQQPRLS